MQLQRLVFSSILLTTLTLLPWQALADIPKPDIPKAKTNVSADKKCVEPVADMRKNHMNYILHQRVDTLRSGVRPEQFKGHSLKECINCHNAPGKDGKVARVSETDHFCNACHSYAAVSIDCFQCHTDKPANTEYRHTEINKKLSLPNSIDSKQLMNQTTQQTLTAKEEKKP